MTQFLIVLIFSLLSLPAVSLEIPCSQVGAEEAQAISTNIKSAISNGQAITCAPIEWNTEKSVTKKDPCGAEALQLANTTAKKSGNMKLLSDIAGNLSCPPNIQRDAQILKQFWSAQAAGHGA